MNKLNFRPLYVCICLFAALLMLLSLSACGEPKLAAVPMPEDGSLPVISNSPTFADRVDSFMNDYGGIVVYGGLILFLLLVSFILDRTGLTELMGFRIVLGLAVCLGTWALFTIQLYLDHGSVSGIMQFVAETWVGEKDGPLKVIVAGLAIYAFPLLAGILWICADEPTWHLLLGFPVLFVVNAGFLYLLGLIVAFIIRYFAEIIGSIPIIIFLLLVGGGTTITILVFKKR